MPNFKQICQVQKKLNSNDYAISVNNWGFSGYLCKGKICWEDEADKSSQWVNFYTRNQEISGTLLKNLGENMEIEGNLKISRIPIDRGKHYEVNAEIYLSKVSALINNNLGEL